jgi:hypothetical protein
MGAMVFPMSAEPPYRFVERPIVPIVRNAEGVATFDVYAKLNRGVPRAADGTPRATLRVQDAGGDTTVATLGRRARHCVTAGVDPSFSKSRVLAHPRVGDVVRVRLYVGGKVVASATTRLSRPLRATTEDQDRPYAAALGCR